MKKTFLSLFIFVTCVSCFAQQKNFGSKTIGQWSFEKFPLHYFITPYKSMSYKNARTGKLERWQEFNQFGQTTGLTLAMGTDGIHPTDASYTYKGEIVYSVLFFPNSKILQSIINYNKDGVIDGYKIYRRLKDSGGYTEEIEKYDNGILIETNGTKESSFKPIYKDSLLDGKFKFKCSAGWIIEGEAVMGKVKKIKQTMDGTIFMGEITFLKDSIRVKKPYTSQAGYSTETFPIKSNPIITNSKLLSKKNESNNGFSYVIISPDFHIFDLEEIVTK